MKLIPKIIFSLAMVCLFTIDSDAQEANISKQLSFPELYPARYEPFTYKQLINIEAVKGRFHDSKVTAMTKAYKPREAYLEILRRAGKLRGDTFPTGYEKYYKQEEIKGMLIRNKPLNFLSDMESIDVYKRICKANNINAIRGDTDDREEVVYNTGDLSNPNPQRKDMCNARCVVAAIPWDMLSPESGAGFKLQNYPTFQQRAILCDDEPYANQPAAADFTAFVVNDSTLITAGHCLNPTMLKRYYYVFDYIMDTLHHAPQYFEEANVFIATKIIPYYDPANNQDVCIIRVNKKIDARRIPALSQQSAVNNSNTYYVIGTPAGIPFKLAGKAKIMENTSPAYFLLNSDTYEGNSGSPVFNASTNLIEGLLITGTKDFRPNILNITCKLSLLCPFDECPGSKGEKILRTSQFLDLIK
ncbi:serine protease [Chitinophaga sp.]|uniref:trypsin-like serine peptidase n=1 Tax=Chitinophaga sp. TaxID=1869181 RepID=UPI002F93C880